MREQLFKLVKTLVETMNKDILNSLNADEKKLKIGPQL